MTKEKRELEIAGPMIDGLVRHYALPNKTKQVFFGIIAAKLKYALLCAV